MALNAVAGLGSKGAALAREGTTLEHRNQFSAVKQWLYHIQR
jgi:hypothetical protein